MVKLGILGGMGPAATAEFLRLLTELKDAKHDQEHPAFVLLEDPKIPDRTAALFEDGEDPSPALAHDLETLASWGVKLVAVPCNTAHVFLDRMTLPVPIIHIVRATVEETKERFPAGALLLATSGTRKSGIYERYANAMNYPVRLPDEKTQNHADAALRAVKASDFKRAAEEMIAITEREEGPYLLACTELPIAYDKAGLDPACAVSSLAALAKATLVAVDEKDSL